MVFHVSLNFDSVKEIQKKPFAPLFFSHFSLSLNRKKTCGNESHEKETKHMLQLLIFYILE